MLCVPQQKKTGDGVRYAIARNKRNMEKVISLVLKFLYRISGLKSLVDWADLMVFNYKLRLRIVPFTFKLFLVTLGATIAFGWQFAYTEYQEISTPLVFTNPPLVQTAEAMTIDEEWKKAEFTAYSASADETDSYPLIMASGKMVYVGAVACPRSMKFGTRIEVRGLGVFTCEDVMALKHDGNFDIFKVTTKEALQFGRKVLEYRKI